MREQKIQSNLFEGVTKGKDKKWLLKIGDPLIQAHLHCIFASRDPEKVAAYFKTGDPLTEVTT